MKGLIGALACLAVLAASPAAAQDITGKWDMTVSTAQGGRQVELTLRKEGEKIVGQLSSEQGTVPVSATLKEKAVTLTLSVQTQNGALDITLSGTVDGDTMGGTADFGGRGQGEWSATRAAAAAAETPAKPAVDVTGAWTFNVTSDAGSGTPTITFKQEGEKLTGQYSGQLGEAPVEGTIKGSEISFWLDVNAQGSNVRITYAGTVEKDTMKGSVNFADMAGGTFTAKKK
jgi:hypothetical protein